MSRQQSRETKSQFEATGVFVDRRPPNRASLRELHPVIDEPAGLRRVVALSPTERADLERLAQHKPGGLARRAGIILARADGKTLRVIANRFNVHQDTVRRWLLRYKQRGLAGLRHGNLGKSRNVVFDAPKRAEICHWASTDPAQLGESFPMWSLLKLRDHLIRRRVVRTISHEALRQVLRAGPSSPRYWRARRGSNGRA